MREHREAMISCRGNPAITAVTRSLIFVLVFCFAGCAAGSCLSYGHSCWGAHGKRSGIHNYPTAGNNVENENDRGGSSTSSGNNNHDTDAESLQDQWILSRLVTRQFTNDPTVEKLRGGNWYESNSRARGRGHGRNWESNDVGVVSNNAKIIHRRDEVQIGDEDEDEEIREEAIQVLPSRERQEEILESQDISEDDELVLVPPSENNLKPIGRSHKLRLFKILNGAAGKLK